MNTLYRGPPIDASYQVSDLLAKRFQRRRILKIRNQNRLWWPCLLMDRESLQRTFHICFILSFRSFGQAVSEKIFRNRPIRNKNCLWWPCLLMDRKEMSTLYRGPHIDASYQDSVHLAKRFQKKRIFKISLSEKSVACGGHVR